MKGYMALLVGLRRTGLEQVRSWSSNNVGTFSARSIDLSEEADEYTPGYSIVLPTRVHDIGQPDRDAVIEFLFTESGQYLRHNVVCL